MTRRQRPIATRATSTVTNRSTGSPGCSIATRTQSHTATAETSRFFTTDAIMSGLPPHIAQIIAGHRDINVTLGYKKSRELHQTSEKPQVTRSTWPWSVVLDRFVAAV